MTTYTIECQYYTDAHASVEFPDGKTWDDVEDWYVKWDYLHIKFKDSEKWEEFYLDANTSSDSTDWKRPLSVSVYPEDEVGSANYDIDLVEKQ